MPKYALPLYDRYVESKNLFGNVMAMMGDAGNFMSSMSKKMFGGKQEEKPAVDVGGIE